VDQQGQLWYSIFADNQGGFTTAGFLGDQVLVNWQYKPYFNVRARRYRFRILNGSVSRYYAFALVVERNGGGGEFPGPNGSNVSYDRCRST